jgi:hypothetical protein
VILQIPAEQCFGCFELSRIVKPAGFSDGIANRRLRSARRERGKRKRDQEERWPPCGLPSAVCRLPSTQ